MPSLKTYRQRRSAGLCVDCGVVSVGAGSARCEDCLRAYRSSRKQLRVERKSRGACTACGKAVQPGYDKCPGCRLYQRQASKKTRAKRVAAGVCCLCPAAAVAGKKHCEPCLSRRRTAYARLRDEAIAAYGGYVCACCGDRTPEFMQIDHVEGGGTRHRKEIGPQMYQWLKRKGFPAGYQVLCANCNFAKGHYGSCPHQRASR